MSCLENILPTNDGWLCDFGAVMKTMELSY